MGKFSIRKEKSLYAEVAKVNNNNKSSLCKIVKKEKETNAILLSYLKLQKLQPQFMIIA